MSSPRFSGLGTHASAKPKDKPADMTGDDPTKPAETDEDELDEDGKSKKDKDMEKMEAAKAELISPNADLHARTKAVFADPKIKGNEARAAEMIADTDFDGLSASALVKIIASTPAPAPQAATDTPEAKAALLAIINANSPEIGADGGEGKVEANHGWDTIHADLRDNRALTV